MSIALIFPGQGSQSVGMLGELAAVYPEVKHTFAEASEALGYDLWALTQDGPAEELNKTDKTQPAMLAAGVAVSRLWDEQGGAQPMVCAGHSLGEYSALVYAGALAFSDAVLLVQERGQYMLEAVPQGQGLMAAVLGLSDAQVREVCAAAAQGEVVSAANYNAPGQVVIAGHKAAVERAMEGAEAAGAKRAIPLAVSVPSHCALMEPAEARLAAHLDKTEISVPHMPIIHNVDVQEQRDVAAIHKALNAQLHQPVRWVETIQRMAAEGVQTVVECGPGKVLTGLNKRIDKSMQALPVFNPKTLDAALEAVQ